MSWSILIDMDFMEEHPTPNQITNRPSMTPIMEDEATVETMEEAGDNMQDAVNVMTSLNLFVAIILGGAMESLVGLIKQL